MLLSAVVEVLEPVHVAVASDGIKRRTTYYLQIARHDIRFARSRNLCEGLLASIATVAFGHMLRALHGVRTRVAGVPVATAALVRASARASDARGSRAARCLRST